jgi:hypothetical protein
MTEFVEDFKGAFNDLVGFILQEESRRIRICEIG